MKQPISEKTPLSDNELFIMGAPVRHLFMIECVRRIASQKKNKKLTILEIGSFLGASMLSWAKGLEKYHTGDSSITCVDSWVPCYKDKEEEDTSHFARINQLLDEGTVYDIFLHNVKCVNGSVSIIPRKGKSENILPKLALESFDIVFVDGDHSYSGVKNDLTLAQKIVKIGGYICGDDLNIQMHQCDQGHMIANREKDTVIDPVLKRKYHPGVTQAVGEVFGEVSEYGGFWLMERESISKWQNVSINEMCAYYPEHFSAEHKADARDHLYDICRDKKIELRTCE